MNKWIQIIFGLLDNKWAKIYLGFILLIALGLIYVTEQDKTAQDEYSLLLIEYNVDTSEGEALYECPDGTYSVYRPTNMVNTICGQVRYD